MIYDSILETIGATPIIRLKKIASHITNASEVFVKLEGTNPGGSIKDRPALHIVTNAIADGLLLPDSTIVESTSGNFGKSLAMIGAALGIKVVLVMDPKAPASTLQFCRAMGARIELISEPAEKGGFQFARLQRLQELLAEIPGSFWPDQYDNPLNPQAHAEVTAQEVISTLPELDVLVVAVSTGGHLSGLACGLGQAFPGLEVVAVDAEGSAIFGGTPTPYLMNGIGLSWKPGNLDLGKVSRHTKVTDAEAVAMCHLAARVEGLFLGPSGGAVLLEALRTAAHKSPGARILGIMPDQGDNYIGQIYDDVWLEAHKLLPLPSDLGALLGFAIGLSSKRKSL